MFTVTWPQTFLFYFLFSGAGCFRPARGAMLFTLSNPQIDWVVRGGRSGDQRCDDQPSLCPGGLWETGKLSVLVCVATRQMA